MKLERKVEVHGYFTVFSKKLNKFVKDIPGVLHISKSCKMRLRLFLNQNFKEMENFDLQESIFCIVGKTEETFNTCISLFGIRPMSFPSSVESCGFSVYQTKKGYVHDCIAMDFDVKYAITGHDLFLTKEKFFNGFSFGVDFLSRFLYGGGKDEKGKYLDQKRWNLVTHENKFGYWKTVNFTIKKWNNAKISLGIKNTIFNPDNKNPKDFSRSISKQTIFSYHFCSVKMNQPEGLNDVFKKIDILQKFFEILFDRPISVTNVSGDIKIDVQKINSKKVEKELTPFNLFCSVNSDRRIKDEKIVGDYQISTFFDDVKNDLNVALENFIENYENENNDGFRRVVDTYLECILNDSPNTIEKLANLCIFLAKDLDSYKYSQLKENIDCLMKSLPKDLKLKNYIEKFDAPEKIKDLRNFGVHLENLLKNSGHQKSKKLGVFTFDSKMVLKILIKFCILRYLFPKNDEIRTNLIKRTESFLLPYGFDPKSIDTPFYTASSKYDDFGETPIYLKDVETELNELKDNQNKVKSKKFCKKVAP